MTDRNIEDLLPWYINGTLNDDERSAVEALLERSSDARKQHEILKALADQVQTEPVMEASELGWRRLQKDIRADKPSEQAATSPARSDGWWKQGVAIAAALVIALQVGILSQTPATDTSTRLLSEGLPSLEQPHWLLQVEFKASAPWQQVSDVLSEIDGRVIDGPSGIGIVRVAVMKNGSQFASQQPLLSWFRAQSVVVHAVVEGEK